MARANADEDRNFDDLAERFKKNVYGGLKGDIRLAVLGRDFAEHLSIAPFNQQKKTQQEKALKPLRILDAGGGQAQFSLALAEAGHQLVVCDISAEMLALGKAQAESVGLGDRVDFVQCPLQSLNEHLADTQFDLVLCHAVMEWMVAPETLLPCLNSYLKPGGYLSLTYYNLHSLIYKNLLRTNFGKIIKKDFRGSKGSLTPISPIDPDQVENWLADLPFELICRSGIRVFHDYIFDETKRNRAPQELLAMELEFSRREPYSSLGRYQHLLLRKNN